MTTEFMKVSVEQIEVFAESLDVQKAADIYKEHGCLVVRGLMKPYLEAINLLCMIYMYHCWLQ